ncbi:MAG TPA: chromosomal replication initiator protein DnaA [Bacteroidales bacterium]|nr:MAG: Chromosomal replication initiator protein DnaA [Bacteroidetes bacterium ADurb.Bin139]HOG24781.1 chromosomal replication initiator protein DnaA [Bacteroidales bacterium]HOR10794.1 chromosomal replication initiator protein DnaA [Bacteroidales bacterium]HOZ19405.1 chromosomal replication initiator protein DnaA [Bacteroidales bacterium]HPK39427.1 chromosomal replication initiator protein DnaA [Bacteroidales bacterium]
MVPSPHKIVWNNCLNIIKDNIQPSSFSTWFEPIVPLKLKSNVLTIEVPSHFFREYIEEHFIDLLGHSLRKELGSTAKLEYCVKVDSYSKGMPLPQQGQAQFQNKTIPFSRINRDEVASPYVIPGIRQLKIDPQLNAAYSFDNFVEGPCNRLARTAGLSIAEKPGGPFNPLFVYGGSGLGKTHLGQAIGIEIKKLMPEKIVLYVSANLFQIQFMDAANVKNKLTDFMHFYQVIDVLIIDDVQDFAGKPGTQNAYFNIFNHLHQSGKQLILTSDKAPVDLKDLDDRLLSRFKWGLSAELQSPDYATRLAILEKKCYNEGVEVPREVLEFIASQLTTNIREIEGTFWSLLAQSTFNKQPVTLKLAQGIIDRLVNTTPREISVQDIQKTVCTYFGITQDVLLSKTRKREICQARQIAMYLSRNLTKNSLSTIGSLIGGKDHATVLHSCNTVCNLMDTDRVFRQYVTDIEKRLKNG